MQLYKEPETLEWEINSEEIKKLPSVLGFPVILLIIIGSYLLYLFFAFSFLLNILGGYSDLQEYSIREVVLFFGPIPIILILWFLYYKARNIGSAGRYYKYSLDKNGINIQNFRSNKIDFYPWGAFDFFYATQGGLSLSGSNFFIAKKEKDFLGRFNTIILRVNNRQRYEVNKFISKYLSFKIPNTEMLAEEINLSFDRKLKEKLGEKFYFVLFFMGLAIIIGAFFIILAANNINIMDRWILEFVVLVAPIVVLFVALFLIQQLKIRNTVLTLIVIILSMSYIIAFKFFPDRLISLISKSIDLAL